MRRLITRVSHWAGAASFMAPPDGGVALASPQLDMAPARDRSRVSAAGLERTLWAASVVLLAIALTAIQMMGSGTFRLATFDQLVHFQAVEPFQQRILIPALVAGLYRLVPATPTLLFALAEIAAWIGLIGLAYRSLKVFEIGRPGAARRWLALTVILPVALMLMLPDLHMTSLFSVTDDRLDLGSWRLLPLYYYVYDLPAAAFTLALTLMLIQRAREPAAGGWTVYFLVFAVATLNRETTVFMIVFFALLFWSRLPRPAWAALVLLHVGILAAIELPLAWLFRDNVNPFANVPGSPYETHIVENLLLFANPLYLIIYLARFAGGLYLPLLLWRRYLNRELALAITGFGLPLIVFAMIVGRAQEHRIFIELMPLLWLGAMQVMAVRFGAPTAERVVSHAS